MPAFFKLHGADIAQRGVQSAVVVERQPVNHLVHRLASGCKSLTVQPAHFQSTPQALRGRVVPAVAFAAHRAFHAVACQRALKLVPAVLTSPVRVEDQSRHRVASEPCHLQSIRHKAALHVRLHTPAHHLAAEQVNNSSQVQPTLIGGDTRDITRLDLIGSFHGEVVLYQIRGDGQMVLTVRGDDKLAFAPGTDAVQLHEPTYPLPAHAMTTCDQFLPHFWPAVLRLDLCMDDTDVGQQSFVAHVLEGARLAQLSKPLRRPCSK